MSLIVDAPGLGSAHSIRDIIRADVGAFLKSAAADGAAPIDTLMLGCTHYPLVADEIAAAFAYWRE